MPSGQRSKHRAANPPQNLPNCEASETVTEETGVRRRTKRSDHTRDAILEAASTAFAEQGYEGTSLDTVALTAGVTKATVYYHFDSKETLYAGLLTRYLADSLDRVERLESLGGCARDRLERLIDSQIDDTLAPSKRYIQYQEFVRTAPEVAESIRAAQQRYELACARIIADGQASGEFLSGDPKLIAMFLIGAIGRTARWYRPDGRVPEDEYRRTILSLLIHGVVIQPSKSLSGNRLD